MPREIQPPTVDPYGSFTHPAYGSISASRVTGASMLYGSDFEHQNTVRVRIGPATWRRNLNQDWHHGSLSSYIEVELSEAQWATFVSTLNSGSGTPCTITERDGRLVPGLPPPDPKQDVFKAEVAGKLNHALQVLNEALAAIDAESLSGAAKTRLKAKVEKAKQELKDNLPFVIDSFGEHVEDKIEEAKVEIEAHLQHAIVTRGLQALEGARPVALPEPLADIAVNPDPRD